MEMYEQAYFGLDLPVPFKGLLIYPVLTKDYYNFYANLSCFTQDKNIKEIKVVDENGIETTKKVANPEGIGMSYMAYLIQNMENQEYGPMVTSQVINMFELVFHEKNGLFCPHCGFKRTQFEVIKEYAKFQETLPDNLSETEKKVKALEFINNYAICPECKSKMRDIYGIKTEANGTKKLYIYDIVLEPKELDEFIAIITHQNILDYDGDRYIDPNLREEMELKARMQNKNYTSPSLEKMLVCISISSSYTMEMLKEQVSLRKLSLMLKTIDAKGYYYAQIQGAMSRLVQFKDGDIHHWIFTDNKKDMSKEIMTMNDFQKKFASVT